MTRGPSPFKKIPWDRSNSSSSFPKEDEKKEEITADAESDTGSFGDALQALGLKLSYSSSAAPADEPVRNDDASSTPPFKMDDESSGEALKDDGTDGSPAVNIVEDSSDDIPASEDSSLLGDGFNASLDARLKELDGMPEKIRLEEEEAQEETTETAVEEDDGANAELYPESVGVDTSSAGVESNSSISKAAGSTASSKQREASSETSNDPDSESATSESATKEADLVVQNVTSEAESNAPTETASAGTAPTEDAAKDVAEEESSEGSEEEKEATQKSKPPLFPKLSRPTSLRKKKKPGIASFFRSRSSSPHPKSDEESQNSRELARNGTVSVDGRLETVTSETDGATGTVTSGADERIETAASETAASAPSQTDASVVSCSDGTDSVEVVAVESGHLEASEAEAKITTSTEEEVAAVQLDPTPQTPIGVVKDASADADMFAKAMGRINAKLNTSCTSNDIQDPWPNPWAGAGAQCLYPAEGQQVNPHIVSNDKHGDSVLENVVGLVLSSEAATINEDQNGEENGVDRGSADNVTVDDILPNPVSLNPDLVGATLNEESNGARSQAQEKADDLEDTRQKQGSCASNESNSGMEATLGDNWDELVNELVAADEAAESTTSAAESRSAKTLEKERQEKQVAEKEEEQPVVEDETPEDETPEDGAQGEETQIEEKESNMKGKRQSSLWKRTKSMVKTRRNSHKNLYQAGQAAKKAQSEEPKKQKFKLGYLCLLAPCGNKRLSTIKEVEVHESKETKRPTGEEENEAAQATKEATEVDAEEPETEEDQPESDPGYDDLVDGFVCTASGNIAPPTGTPTCSVEQSHESEKSRSLPEDAPKKSQKRASKAAKTDIEESKSDLIQIELVDSKLSKNSKPWLAGGQSIDVESLMMAPGDFVHKTFSDVSTIGDISETEAGPNMISSINFYVAAAQKALQHNLYDVPAHELEKFRANYIDYACFHCNEDSSLSDRGISMTMSSDSGAVAIKPLPDDVKRALAAKVHSEGGKMTVAGKMPQSDGASGKKMRVPAPIPESAEWKSSNPFALATSAFNELIEVLEFNHTAKQQSPPNNRPSMSPTKSKFEEQKIEMFGSVSS